MTAHPAGPPASGTGGVADVLELHRLVAAASDGAASEGHVSDTQICPECGKLIAAARPAPLPEVREEDVACLRFCIDRAERNLAWLKRGSRGPHAEKHWECEFASLCRILAVLEAVKAQQQEVTP